MNNRQPDYKRAFEQDDFKGYFVWTSEFTEKLNCNYLYHACHEEELRDYLESNKLELRSKWSLMLPEHGECKVPGVWTGLNYYTRGNQYGPLLISFPLSVLNGRNFMVFRRNNPEDRRRYFFVQYEARIPVYSYNEQQWKSVKPENYFSLRNDDTLWMKESAIYDIVLTRPLSLRKSELCAVTHPRCISGKCSGLSDTAGKRILKEIAKNEFSNWLLESKEYKRILKQFSILDGIKFELFDPESI